MASIDERVVNMKFNNAQFKTGIQSTMTLLDKFKTKFNFSSSKQSVDELQGSVGRFNMNPMVMATQSVGQGFNAMGAVAFSVLNNITTAAMNAGTNLVKSLTLDQVTAGFQEYELKMGSIQTILANTQAHGTTLDNVSTSLGELNEYADKTIYNFGDMTRNIGLFTNAGLKLEESTAMIKGFSNAAAASGASAQGASHAAYQLSQGLSAGYLTAMDWMSLTNAGMGNKNMQTDLIAIAEAMGTFSNGSATAETATKDFKNTLADGKWLTKDVMSTYLQTMAGDLDKATLMSKGLTEAQADLMIQNAKTGEEAATKVRTMTQLIGGWQEAVGSGWAQTFEILFGDFNEATELFSGINDVIGPMLDGMGAARNELLQGFVDLGGRVQVVETVKNLFNGLLSVLRPIGEAFRNVFPPATAQQLWDIAYAIQRFTDGLILSGETGDKVRRTFEGIFAIFSIAGQIIGGVIGVIFDLIGSLAGAGGGFLSITATIGDWLVKVDDALKSGDLLKNIFEVIGDVLKAPIEMLKTFGSVIGSFLTGIDFSSFSSGLSSVGEALGSFGGSVKDIFGKIGGWIKSGITAAQDALSGFQTTMTDSVGGIDFSTILGVGAAGGLGLAIRKVLKDGIGIGVKDVGGIFDSFKETLEGATGMFESVTGVFDGLTESLTLMQTEVKADILIKIAIAVGLLSASIVALSTIDPGRMITALGGIAMVMGQLLLAMEILGTVADTEGFHKVPVIAGAMILLSTAVLILTAAVKVLASMSWAEMAQGLVGVAAAIGVLVAAVHLMPDDKKLMSSATAMNLMATSLLLMAQAVKSFADLSWEEMAQGLVGVGVSLGLLVGAMQLMPDKKMMSTAASLILMGAALNIMATAVKSFSDLSWEDMLRGLAGVAGSLGAIAAAMWLMPKDLTSTAANLILVGVALSVIAEAMKAFAGFSWEEIGRGLAGMAGSLAVIAGALWLMPTDMAKTGAGLMMVSVGISIISGALATMGGMGWEEIAKGLVALAGSLGILAGALYLMNGTLAGSAALTVASFALGLLVPVLIALGAMSWQAIVTGLGAMAGALAVLGIASLALAPVIPAMLGLAGAIAAFSAASLVAGVAITALAAGLGMLAGPASEGINTLGQLISLFPMMLGKFAEGIVMFLGVLAANAGKIVAAITVLVIQILEAALNIVVTMVPQFVQAFVTIVSALLGAIVELAPAIGEAFLALLMTLLEVIATAAPAIIDTFTLIILRLLDAVIVLTPRIGEAITTLVITLLDILAQSVPAFADRGLRMLRGVLDAIANNIGQVVDSATNIVVNFIDGISRNLPRVIQSGVELIIAFVNGLADGIRNNEAAMREAAANLGRAIIDGLGNAIRAGAQSVINAITGIASDALNAAKSLLGIHSPSREFYEVGKNVDEGWANGIEDNGDEVISAASFVAAEMQNVIRDATTGGITDLNQLMVRLTEVDRMARHGIATGQMRAFDISDATAEMTKWGDAFGAVGDSIGAVLDIVDVFERLNDKLWVKKEKEQRRVTQSGKDIGDFYTEGIRKGFEEGTSDVTDASVTMAQGSLNGAEQVFGFDKKTNEFEKMGTSAGKGLASGIRSWLGLDAGASDKTTKRVLREVVEEYMNMFKEVDSSIKTLVSSIETFQKLDEMIFGVTGLINPQMQAAGMQMVGSLAAGIGMSIPQLGLAVAGVAGVISLLFMWMDDETKNGIVDGFKSIFKGIVDFIKYIFGPIVSAIKTVVTPVFDALKTIFGSFKDLFGDLFSSVGRVLASIIKLLMAVLSPFIVVGKAIWDLFGGVLGQLARLFAAILTPILVPLVTTLTLLADIISAIVNVITRIVEAVFGTLGSGANLITKIIGLFARLASSTVLGLLTAVLDRLIPILEFVLFVVEGIAGAVEFLVHAILWLVDILTGGFEGALNKLVDGVNLLDIFIGMMFGFGQNVITGLIDGIKSAGSGVMTALRSVVHDAVDGFKGLLGINSPSKVFEGFGKNLDEGLANGIRKGAKDPAKEATAVGNSAKDALRKAFQDMTHLIDTDMELNPVISPVLDLTNVRKDARQLADLSVGGSFGRASDISAIEQEERNRQLSEADAAGESSSTPAKIEFKQYNNSPKALSPIEIYRQTRNQLSMAERKLPL